MPLKPIFDKAPLTTMNSQPLCAGLVRMENAVLNKLYSLTSNAGDPAAYEGVFRLACIVTAKPGEEPVAAKIRAVLAAQKEDGSFNASFKESVAILRATWAMYEYEARKPLLDPIARWCGYAVRSWDALMADDEIWVHSADLLELLENLYRVTGNSSVLALCERVATQTMGWSSVLNTISSQRPTNRTITLNELRAGLSKDHGSREGYYTHFYRTNHAEALADGARSTMAKGWYSGSATELNATRNGWERLNRYHGAVCGGLTSDELLEGTSPLEVISTAALGAWAEALCSAALGENPDWVWNVLERMAYNAMPACLTGEHLQSFQRVNSLENDVHADNCFYVAKDHDNRSANRLTRGYAALVSSAVTARADGMSVNLYLPGRYAVPMGDGLLILTMNSSVNGYVLTIHCKQETKAAIRLRIPEWSKNTEVTVNGADLHGEVKGNAMTFDRIWHDGDVIALSFEQRVTVLDGHHQGKFVLRGPVLMALDVQDCDWKYALVSVTADGNNVKAELDQVKEWKVKGYVPADIPVLPETEGNAAEFSLTPYAKTTKRIALFPGRKQA